jgi:hypothetical protein
VLAAPGLQATAAAQERQLLAEERADAGAAAKRGQQAAALAQQRVMELEARVQVYNRFISYCILPSNMHLLLSSARD